MLHIAKSFLLVFMMLWGLLAADQSHHKIVNEVIKDVLWTSETKTDDGKIAYFGMEKLTKERMNLWTILAENINFLASGDRGIGTIPYFLALLIDSKINPSNNEINAFIKNDLWTRYSGFSDTETKQFRSEMEQKIDKGLFSKEKRDSRSYSDVNAMAGISAGRQGLSAMLDAGNYIVYASSHPIKGALDFSKIHQQSFDNPFTYKMLRDQFGHILMLVGSSMSDDPIVYENRGIMKNLTTFLETPKQYTNLSLKLHAFSALVVKHLNPEKRYFGVSAVPVMADILRKNLKPGEEYYEKNPITPEAKAPDDLTKHFIERVDLGGSFLIKIDALIKKF